MNLLIDIGNTRLKWACEVGTELLSCGASLYREDRLFELLTPAWKTMSRPERVFVSNVAGAGIATAVEDYVADRWGVKPCFLHVSETALGVINGYEDTAQLGIDRWLAMIAAWNRCRSTVCIVDCGTALTVDVVAASGQHLGGYIVPGMALMRDMLSRRTQLLKPTHDQQASTALGLNTGDCIRNGTVLLVTALLREVQDKIMCAPGEAVRCIITGGDAEEIQAVMENGLEYDPHLVLQGIALMAANS